MLPQFLGTFGADNVSERFERTIALQPDLVMTYWSLDPSYDAHPVLDQAGRAVVTLVTEGRRRLAIAEAIGVQRKSVDRLFQRGQNTPT